jgi:hypothetical protein
VSDVFLSYKREDQARVAPIVEGLRAAGLSVWWDRDIGGGESWRQTIHEQLEAARCVVVVWSETSIGPLGEFVHDEAGRAKARGVLLPVRIDAVRAPIGFGQVQTLDLAGWRGNARDRRFQPVVATVKAILSGKPRPRPRPLGYWARLVAKWGGGFALAATLIGFATDLAGLQKPLCTIPGVHAMCAAWGLGGVPTREETALWAARQPGDCDGLKSYVARYPNGPYADEANRRLQAKRSESSERWTPQEQRLPLAVRSTQMPQPSEESAKADALKRGEDEAKDDCELLTTGGVNRVLSSHTQVKSWRCLPRGGGTACGFDGWAICQVEARSVETREVCP